MPTGYTHEVQSGEVTDFPTFTMQCARAFGALIMMRDDPSDAQIPEQFEPSDYNRRARERAVAELQRLQNLTWDEIGAAARADYDAAVRCWETSGTIASDYSSSQRRVVSGRGLGAHREI